MADFSFTDDDKQWAKLLQLAIKDQLMSVGIGFIDAGADGSVLQKAIWNEFGTKTSPPRPFFAKAYEQNLDKLSEFAGKLADQILTSKITKEQALDKMGLWFANRVKASIRSGDFAENAPSTIRQKGSSKPLIDSGQMMNAVTWQVKKGM